MPGETAAATAVSPQPSAPEQHDGFSSFEVVISCASHFHASAELLLIMKNNHGAMGPAAISHEKSMFYPDQGIGSGDRSVQTGSFLDMLSSHRF
jgi:hypothetical protein